MKKIVMLSVLLVLLAAAASAQRNVRVQRFNNSLRREITPLERFELRKDTHRYIMMQRRARRDGTITPFERYRIHKAKNHLRRDAYRFKHNNRRRVI